MANSCTCVPTPPLQEGQRLVMDALELGQQPTTLLVAEERASMGPGGEATPKSLSVSAGTRMWVYR